MFYSSKSYHYWSDCLIMEIRDIHLKGKKNISELSRRLTTTIISLLDCRCYRPGDEHDVVLSGGWSLLRTIIEWGTGRLWGCGDWGGSDRGWDGLDTLCVYCNLSWAAGWLGSSTGQVPHSRHAWLVRIRTYIVLHIVLSKYRIIKIQNSPAHVWIMLSVLCRCWSHDISQ